MTATEQHWRCRQASRVDAASERTGAFGPRCWLSVNVVARLDVLDPTSVGWLPTQHAPGLVIRDEVVEACWSSGW